MKALGLAVLMCAILLPCAAQEQPAVLAAPTLTPDQMAEKALQGDIDILKLLKTYTFTKRVLVEIMDNKGKERDRDERVYQLYPCGGLICSKVLSINGAPPKPKDLKEHEKNMKKDLERQRKLTAADKQKEEDEALFLSGDFLKIYTFTPAAPDAAIPDAAHVLAFTPHDQKVKLANKDNKVLSKMAGRMWLDRDMHVLSSEMHTIKSIKVWGGFAGAINNLQAKIDYVRDPSGIYLPRKVETNLELRILMSKGRWRITEEYSDFIAPAATAAAAKPD